LSEKYDCGCGDEPVTLSTKKSTGADTLNSEDDPMDLEDDLSRDKATGADLIRGGR